MSNVVIVEAARTPIGRRRGQLAGVHPAVRLGPAQKARRGPTGHPAGPIGQQVGGAVTRRPVLVSTAGVLVLVVLALPVLGLKVGLSETDLLHACLPLEERAA